MKLSLLRLHRAPGLDKGLGELRFEGGLNVVFGPNESGKSTLARAIQSTLWPQGREQGVHVDVETEWSEGDQAWSARHDGETVWTRDGEVVARPALPGAENSPAYRLHLRDLIADVGEGHEDFAKRVRAALDGGYDLMKRATEERSRRHGGSEKRELTTAERELRVVEGRREDLGRKVDDLGRLESEKQAADAARHETQLLERVKSAIEAGVRLEQARAAFEADPTPSLLGHEQGDLEALDHALTQCERERIDLESQLQDARDELRGLALPERLPESSQTSAWLDELRVLFELERALGEANTAVQNAVVSETRAREALLVTRNDLVEVDAPLFSPSVEQVDELAGWLDHRSRLADERRALEARRRLLAEPVAAGEDPATDEALDEETLVRGRGLLGAYLRAGPGLLMPALWGGVTGAVVTGLSFRGALPLEGLAPYGPEAGWVAVSALVATLCGAAIGLVLGRGLARRRLRSALLESGLDEASGASDPAQLFDQLDLRLRALHRATERARECDRLEAELLELDARAPALEERRRRLVEGLGIDPSLDDLTVVEWARRLQAHRDAASDLAGARSAASQLLTRVEVERARLFEAVAPFVPERPATVSEALRAIEDLRHRIESADHARKTLAGAERSLEQLEIRRAEHDAKRSSLLERWGLERLDASSAAERLRSWTEALPVRQERQKAVEQALAVTREFERELEGHEELVDLGPFEVDRRLDAARERAEGAARLSEEIGAIAREVELAEQEESVEIALDRVNQAYDALERRRMEVFEGAAARLLVDDVAEQIGTRQRPEVLSRATDLFGLFTRHRYELEVSHDGDRARFVARSTESNQRKRLEQLSDGTRMQLLLAARLAFVHDGERGVHPPLVLDEALSSSDTTRMDAMTDALVAEAETERQIFYMTNDWGDVDRWKAACERAGAEPPNVVHLGEARLEENAARWNEFEPPTLRPPVPSPQGLSAAEFAARLGVPLPDPWDELGRLHLFHLLADDPELVRRVLEDGSVELFGQFESRRRNGVAAELLGADLVDHIVFRGRVAERFFSVWRRGRGRRLRPGDLDESGQVSEKFREKLSNLLADVGGNARALMDRIAEKQDARVKGFREKNRVGLEEYLFEHGFLSNEDPLGDDEVVAEVSAGLGEGVFEVGREEGRQRLREADALVRLWIGLLRHGDDAA